MKTNLLRIGLMLFFAFALTVEMTNAQTKPKPGAKRTPRTRAAATGYGSTNYGNAAVNDTTKKRGAGTGNEGTGYGNTGYGNSTQSSGAANDKKTTFNQKLPIEVVKGGSGIGDTIRPSLRTDNAIDRNLVKDRNPLVYEHIREDDAVYKQRVWREIDTREKMNLPFRYSANEDNGNQRFISILFDAIQSGNVTAFSGDDDRFTTPLTKEDVAKTITGGLDTVPQYTLDGDVKGYQVRQKMIEPDSIYRYRLKEEWIFDKESSRMVVRILGIAPIMTQRTSTGEAVGDVTIFWVYYPDLRPTLAKFEVYNGKNFAGRMSWEELFESRYFSSYITKSTLDNPFDKNLREFIKDPLFRLLEGENIKEKIFNYEQDLWSY